MKKQLMGLAACALILSSCSQNQEIENYEQMNREEVRLAPYVNKTKASVTDLDAMKDANYSGFKVFAVQHASGTVSDYSSLPVFMDQLKVKYGTDWAHDGKYYWPESDALSFFAVAPFNGTEKIKVGEVAGEPTKKPMILPITINDKVADQIDILAASMLNLTKNTNVTGQVDFQFKHILSRIGFAAKVKDGDNLKFKIKGISFGYGTNIVKNGTFTFNANGTGTMVSGSTKHVNNTDKPNESHTIGIKTPEGTIIATNSFVTINADDAYLMLMPQKIPTEGTDINLMTMILSYDVAVAGNEYSETGKTATIQIPAMNYEQGKAYTYNLILSSKSGDDGSLLEVTFDVVKVEDWGEQTEGNVDVLKPITPPAQN